MAAEVSTLALAELGDVVAVAGVAQNDGGRRESSQMQDMVAVVVAADDPAYRLWREAARIDLDGLGECARVGCVDDEHALLGGHDGAVRHELRAEHGVDARS